MRATVQRGDDLKSGARALPGPEAAALRLQEGHLLRRKPIQGKLKLLSNEFHLDQTQTIQIKPIPSH